MSRVKFRWSHNALKRLRTTPEVERAVMKIAGDVSASAGDGYEVANESGHTRARGRAYTATADAMRNESKNSSMLRALQSRGM